MWGTNGSTEAGGNPEPEGIEMVRARKSPLRRAGEQMGWGVRGRGTGH